MDFAPTNLRVHHGCSELCRFPFGEPLFPWCDGCWDGTLTWLSSINCARFSPIGLYILRSVTFFSLLMESQCCWKCLCIKSCCRGLFGWCILEVWLCGRKKTDRWFVRFGDLLAFYRCLGWMISLFSGGWCSRSFPSVGAQGMSAKLILAGVFWSILLVASTRLLFLFCWWELSLNFVKVVCVKLRHIT